MEVLSNDWRAIREGLEVYRGPTSGDERETEQGENGDAADHGPGTPLGNQGNSTIGNVYSQIPSCGFPIVPSVPLS